MWRIKAEANTLLPLGRLGENNRLQILFDVSDWLEEFPDATIGLNVKLPYADDFYPAVITTPDEDGYVAWTIGSGDLSVVGKGECELIATEDTTIVKSAKWRTEIYDAITGNSSTPPEPWDTWEIEFNRLKGEAEDAAEAAEDAQEAAEAAQTAAESAQTAAETAQGLAEAAQSAAESAQTAAETAQGKAETAQGEAETAQLKAEVAQGKAENAQTAAETAQGKAEDAQEAAETAQTAAETAQGLAEDAQDAAEDAAEAAEAWATGGTSGTPSATNNAKYYSEVAAAATEDKADKVEDAVSGNFAALDANGNLTDSGHKHSDYLTGHQDISGKADKVSGAVNGNFAGLDTYGNLTDSGKKASDFALASSIHNVPSGGSTNQVLAKNSGTDYDLKWVDQSGGGGGGASIDDTAGSGDTSHAWSADKLVTEFAKKVDNTNGAISNSLKIGSGTNASGSGALAAGNGTSASGDNATAEGMATTASGNNAHSEGRATQASGTNSHAEGYNTQAKANGAHSEGKNTIANAKYQHVFGKYNTPDSFDDWDEWTANTTYAVGDYVKVTDGALVTGYRCIEANSDSSFTEAHWEDWGEMNYIEIAGNGKSGATSNARTLDWDGNEALAGDLKVFAGTNDETSVSSLKSAINGIEESIAPVESSATATSAHAVGELFMLNDSLLVALSAIAVGDTITTTGNSPNAAVTTLSSKLIKDVQVNGSSVLTNGVANVPLASSSTPGVAKVNDSYGIQISNGVLLTKTASGNEIKNDSSIYNVISPYNKNAAVFYGLAGAAGDTTQKAQNYGLGVYTESAKSSIHSMLDAPETVSGSTPSITAKSGVRYICGEVATLTIVVPASGIIDVTFESGSTPTVLTVTPPTGVTAIKWANGFDPSSLDEDTVYEINILDGEYGVVGKWT